VLYPAELCHLMVFVALQQTTFYANLSVTR